MTKRCLRVPVRPASGRAPQRSTARSALAAPRGSCRPPGPAGSRSAGRSGTGRCRRACAPSVSWTPSRASTARWASRAPVQVVEYPALRATSRCSASAWSLSLTCSICVHDGVQRVALHLGDHRRCRLGAVARATWITVSAAGLQLGGEDGRGVERGVLDVVAVDDQRAHPAHVGGHVAGLPARGQRRAGRRCGRPRRADTVFTPLRRDLRRRSWSARADRSAPDRLGSPEPTRHRNPLVRRPRLTVVVKR